MNIYRRLLHVALFALPAFNFVGCNDDDDDRNEAVYPATLEIVTSSGNEFGGAGGTLQLLVSSNVDYDVTTDVDWITPVLARSGEPLNGMLTFMVAPYDASLDMTPRTGNIILSADGTEDAVFTVSQVAAELYRFEILSAPTVNVPAKGGDVEITVKGNVDYTVEISDPSWISETSGFAGVHVFAVGENTVTEPRSALVTFRTAQLGDFPVEITQDAFTAARGISSANDLMAFAAAVNAGDALDAFTDDNGEVVLLADIDMAGQEWTPIGNVTGSSISNGKPTLGTGNPFTGVFNGNGHTIRNLAMVTDVAQTMALFGSCKDAVIKNLNIDGSCTLKVVNEDLTAGSAYGFVAGLIMTTTIENVRVSGTVEESLLYMGTTKYLACMGGIAGYALSSTLRGCTFDGKIERVRSNVYDNSLGSVVSGILGFSRGASNAETVLEDCTNAGSIYAMTHRVAGILGGTPGYYILRNCTNSGIVHASAAETAAGGWTSGLRVGGVLAFSSNTSATTVATVENCSNSGTVVCEGDAKTLVGALCGNPRCFTLTNGVNSGTLVSTGGNIAGLIVGQLQCADKPVIVSASCGGRFATAFSGTGADVVVSDAMVITADNYFSYAAGAVTGTNSDIWTTSNVTFLAQ